MEEIAYTGRRATNLGANVEAWCEKTGEGSTDHDVCSYHAEKLEKNLHTYDNLLHPRGHGEPQGEDGWGGDVEHPPYSDAIPGDEYRCAVCDDLLGD